MIARNTETSLITTSCHEPERSAHVGLMIAQGCRADYAMLAHIHYRSGPPATFARVLKASLEGQLLGVLVVSFPTLNGLWRFVAWPELFATKGLARSDQATTTRVLNAHVRTISRVITDPRARGLGIAQELVSAYLNDPQTPCTEAIAALPSAGRIFAHAGMRVIDRQQSASLDGLRLALRSIGAQPWQAMDLAVAKSMVRRSAVRAAVMNWATSSRGTNSAAKRAKSELGDTSGTAAALLLSKAASQLLYVPKAYVTP